MPIDYDNFLARVIEAFGCKNVKELARELGMSEQGLYKWQKGTIPELDRLADISRSTSRSIHWLLTGEEGPISLTFLTKAQADFIRLLAKTTNKGNVEGTLQELVVSALTEWAARMIAGSLRPGEVGLLREYMQTLLVEAAKNEKEHAVQKPARA